MHDIEAMRAAVNDSVTLDIYVESPAGFGGGMLYGSAPKESTEGILGLATRLTICCSATIMCEVIK